MASMVGVSPVAPADEKKPAEFAQGIIAQDRSNWQLSAELLREALKKRPEDGTRALIYGTRFSPYLPHFYLGLALYRQDKCAEAIQEWEKSRRAGFVQQLPKYIEDLDQYSHECRRKLN